MFNFKNTKNDYEIRIFALRRSGSNAISNWIINHFGNNEVFYLSAIPKEFLLKPEIFKRKQQASIDNYGAPQLKQIHTDTAFRKSKRCLMYRFEDCNLNKSTSDRINSHYYGKSNKLLNIVILRDAYNMTASRMEYNPKVDTSVMVGEFYKDLLKQYLTRMIDQSYELTDTIFISFNEWFMNKKYRESFSEWLGLEHTDKGLNQINPYGIGSSFDGKKFQGKAQQMDVFNRWQKYKNNPIFRSVVDDPEIQEMNNYIFGGME